MNPTPEQPHAVRRVVLPSGKTIEVVYFADESGTPLSDEVAPATVPTQGPTTELHTCEDCSSDLVYPVAWEEAGNHGWQLELRCPNCEWTGEGTYDQMTVERLDEELDRGTSVLVRDLKALMQANMEEEMERFITALRADQIWPMDF
jgi:hypothetical protein